MFDKSDSALNREAATGIMILALIQRQTLGDMPELLLTMGASSSKRNSSGNCVGITGER